MITKLAVPYHDKDKAKALGARFNMGEKVWYVPDGLDIMPFKRWLPKKIKGWVRGGKIK